MIKQRQHSLEGDKKSPNRADGKTPARTPQQNVLFFDPDTIVAGILYHFADEGIGSVVEASTIASLRRRLKRMPVATMIKRSRWESMSNPQRLEWLLAISESCFQVRDDATIAIAHRR